MAEPNAEELQLAKEAMLEAQRASSRRLSQQKTAKMRHSVDKSSTNVRHSTLRNSIDKSASGNVTSRAMQKNVPADSGFFASGRAATLNQNGAITSRGENASFFPASSRNTNRDSNVGLTARHKTPNPTFNSRPL